MPITGPNVRILFPVPLLTFRIAEADAMNRELLAEIGQRRSAEEGMARSNVDGWHSATDLFDRPEPAHAALAGEIRAMCEAATAKLVPNFPKELALKYDGWVNVNPTGGLNAPHDHPGVFWSGCYYVEVPAPQDEADDLSGAIEFIDPRGSIGTNGAFEAPFTVNRHTVRPEAGTAFIWPAFMRHWVHPNRATRERVTVAFNARFSRAD